MKNTSLILSIISLVAVVTFGILSLTGKNTATAEVVEETAEVASKGDIVYIDLDISLWTTTWLMTFDQ